MDSLLTFPENWEVSGYLERPSQLVTFHPSTEGLSGQFSIEVEFEARNKF